MKTPLRKLRSAFHNYKQDRKDGKVMPLDRLDELDKASEDMQEMRDSYDSLLSSAAAAASSAYEFSESLKDMGSCLLRKVAINDDEETGKVLLMLGKVQLELHRLLDNYRAHIFQTITVPSESLLNELQNVEEMKRQCDEKRVLYEYMRSRHKEKGRSKSGKGETYTSQQLQMAREQFDEDTTLFVFRLKSLKQGQSRSLLTQTARHHAAQLSFFRKALKALETVDPHVQSVTMQQHIDYQFSGLDDDESEYDDDDSNSDYNGDSEDSNGELSFDYRRIGHQGSISATRNLTEENIHSAYGEYDFRDRKLLSQSAPLFPQRKAETAERIRQLQPSSTKKFHTYVLPKPGDTNKASSPVSETSASHARGPLDSQNISYSMPLELKSQEKLLATAHFSGPISLNSQYVLKENNSISPPQLAENISLSHLNRYSVSDAIRIKRLSHSGPITSRPMSTAISPYARKLPEFSSGPIPRSSPKISPSVSPTFMASPRINELHELPRPPNQLGYDFSRASGFVGHSAPLVSGVQEKKMSVSKKLSVTWAASPLPAPPSPTRSSVPSNSSRADVQLPSSKRSEASSPERGKDNGSPPLTPFLLSDAPPE